jgi:hypothetical protein
MFLLGKEYETCKSCAILKEQLKSANEEKERLTETLLSLINPKIYETPAKEVPSFQGPVTLWSRRRAELEKQDRIAANALKSPLAAVPDDRLKNKIKDNKLEENKELKKQTVEELERELGVDNG